MKKPEGLSDDQFKRRRTPSSAWLTSRSAIVTFTKAVAAKSKKLQTAIDELKTAADLLGGNPELQGQALFYLAYAYESGSANHKAALEALTKASSLQSSWKGQADDLLAKVKKAATKQAAEQCSPAGASRPIRTAAPSRCFEKV